MNSKMTTNPQLSTTEPKKMKTKTKQTTRIGTESEKWTSHRVFSVGKNGGGQKVQGIRSVNGRYKMDRGRLRIVLEMEKPKNLYVGPMDMNW